MCNAPEKRRSLPYLLAVLLLASVSPLRGDSVSLSFSNEPSGTVTNGTLVPVYVIAATSGAPSQIAVTLNFRTLAPLCTNTWNAMAMATNLPPTNFLANLPRLPAGSVEFYTSCSYVDSGTLSNKTGVSVTKSYTVGTTLDVVRCQNFDSGTWTANISVSPYNNWEPSTGWTGTLITVVSNSSRTPPLNSSPNWLRLRNSNGAYVMSPDFPAGIGTIYFEAGVSFSDPLKPQTILVQVSADDGTNWTTKQSFTMIPGGVIGDSDIRPAVQVNTNVSARVRIYQPNQCAGGSQFVFLDNLNISYPPADLLLSQPANRVTPSTPVSYDPVTIRCNVSDLSTNIPTINRRMTMFYTYMATNGVLSPTNSLVMTNAPGLPDQYAAEIPGVYDAGTNFYYYRCEFDGYYYTNSDKRGPYYFSAGGQTSTNTVPTNKFSYAINRSNVRSIRLLPAGGISFGLCATNATLTNSLFICNDGNVPMTVSNLVFSAPGFSHLLTSNIVVSAQRTQSVSVVFQPVTNGPYSVTLTVQSDKTTGSDTCPVSGTGMPFETVSTPGVTGDAAGTLAQRLYYSTSGAVDNWGYSVEYRFNCNDGWTSGWSVATSTSRVWSVLGMNYQIRAQARSATNQTVVSDWSEPPWLVSITNTAQINLLGNLGFGILNANQTSNRVMLVTNSGPGALSVTNITFSNSVFTISATNFVVLPSAFTNLTVSFAPLSAGFYAGTVVVWSDATSGTNTMAITGNCETVSAPGLTSGVLAGHVSDPQPFSFSAVSSSAHPVEYLYAWGDGAITNWTSSATLAHAWLATNDYPLLVQARCQIHTNVTSSLSGTNLVRIYDPPVFVFSTITNGQPFRVTMTATGAPPGSVTNCVFNFLPPLSTTMVPTNLTYVSNNDWTAMIPPLNQGSMQYYLQYLRSSLLLRYPAVTNQTLSITNSVGPSRWVNFEGATWTANNVSPYNNWEPSTGWTGTQMTVVLNTSRTPPLNNTASWLRMRNASGAYIMSPDFVTGIGAIYFEAGLSSSDALRPQTILVQVSTNGGTNWITQQSFTMTPGGAIGDSDIHPCIQVNLRMPARFRIYQPNLCASGSQFVFLDNIVASPPPTDVQISEVLMNPGYPNYKDPVRIRCQTSDYTNLVTGAIDAPSINRRLSVWYRHESLSDYVSTNMIETGSRSYEGVIPAEPVGNTYYYIKCDFDGYFFTNSIITNTVSAVTNYPSEKISPSYLPDHRPGPVYATYPQPGTSGRSALSYFSRLYRSEQQRIRIQTTPSSAASVMELVDDYTWQGTTLITGITDLSWFFEGDIPYSNNATSFGTMISWGDTNQYYLHYPPMGGFAEVSTSEPLRAELAYSGLLVYRFVSTNGYYLVRKGTYQNFDNWQASQDYFEESYGLYAVQTFTNYFTAWANDTYPTNMVLPASTDFSSEPMPSPFYGTPHIIGDWLAWGCINTTTVVERSGNQAMLLNNVGAPGFIENTSKGVTEGLRSFTCRARLSQTDGRYAVYSKELLGLDFTTNSWTNAYRLTNTIYCASMTPGYASISTLFCYRYDNTNYFDLGTFYELRLTQYTNDTLRLRLYRWNDGVMTGMINYTPADEVGKLTGEPLQFDIAWTNAPTNAVAGVRFSGRIYRDPADDIFSWTTNLCQDTAGINLRIENGGVVGFLCSDAEMEIRALDVYRGTNLSSEAKFSESGFGTNSWFLGRTSEKPDCWQISGGVLKRSLPSASTLGVDMIRTGTVGDYDKWLKYWTTAAQYSVASFGYTTFSYQPSFWDQVFLHLDFVSGELPIVVDDLTLENWRAYTRGQTNSADASSGGVAFWDWNNVSQQYAWSQAANTGWLIFEGLVESISGNPYVSFDRSRANTNLSQGVWSLLLTNGLGSIAFRATVDSGTSVYRVEYTDPFDPDNWLPEQCFTNTSADLSVDRYVPVRRTNTIGRIRIVQLPESSANARLKLDNLIVRDYPPVDDGTWRAYNCLIARPSTNNSTITRAYETSVALFEHQTCYLNNSTSNGVRTGVLAEFNPFIQSPRVDTGIGQIAFWYRAWDATNAAFISIQAAPGTDGPWTVITNFTASSTNYAYFDTGPGVYYPDDQIMRIYVTNVIPSPTTGRLCIDNILMAESARPSYTITDVKLLPSQPLSTDQAGVQVTIDRLVMDPKGSRLFLSYTTDTNSWGYLNWWGTGTNPLPGVVTLELSNSVGNVYVSAGTNFIPAMNVDTVVQFVVWGICSNLVGRPMFQGTNAFTNPSWYFPVNLNVTRAPGWSPYYYVYSCPTGSVWINEINYYAPGWNDNEKNYFELIGPQGVNVGNWQIKLFNEYNVVSDLYDDICVIDGNFTFSNVNNGWGFFVWGSSDVASRNQLLGTPIAILGVARLIRSMGAWEDTVCWGKAGTAEFESYRYAGRIRSSSPLALIGGPGSNKYDFAWDNSGVLSPGLANDGQLLANIYGTGMYYFLASIVGLHGTHSLGSNGVWLAQGSTATVTYAADPWYRILTFTSDNVVNPSVSGTNQFVWSVTNVMQNISNNVTFCLLPNELNGQSVPTWWLATFGRPEAAPFDSDGYVLQVEYMLNMDPYVSNAVPRFTVDAIAVTGTTVSVTVRLLESTNGVTYYAQPNINGTLYLQGRTNLLGGSWSTVTSQVPTNVFDGNGRKVFSFPADTNLFYRAFIQ